MSKLKKICFLLVVIGALNWGLIGLFNFNLVSMIFGEMSIFSRIIYILVGISGAIIIANTKDFCKTLNK